MNLLGGGGERGVGGGGGGGGGGVGAREDVIGRRRSREHMSQIPKFSPGSPYSFELTLFDPPPLGRRRRRRRFISVQKKSFKKKKKKLRLANFPRFPTSLQRNWQDFGILHSRKKNPDFFFCLIQSDVLLKKVLVSWMEKKIEIEKKKVEQLTTLYDRISIPGGGGGGGGRKNERGRQM